MNLDEILEQGEKIESYSRVFCVDDSKAFKKLSQKQFTNPLAYIRELIANSIDSYEGKLGRIELKIEEGSFQITDYGSGMTEEKLLLLRTLGGSDKQEQSAIGRFGIGFASIFNPKIKAKKVIVDTQAKNHITQTYNINKLNEQVTLDEICDSNTPQYKTRIRVEFEDNSTNRQVKLVEEIIKIVKYLPNKIYINGSQIETDPVIKSPESAIPLNGKATGWLKINSYSRVEILSKKLHINYYDIDEIPYIDNTVVEILGGVGGVINIDEIGIVPSRNQLIFDNSADEAVEEINVALDKLLERKIKEIISKKNPYNSSTNELEKMVNNYWGYSDHSRPGVSLLRQQKVIKTWNVGLVSLEDLTKFEYVFYAQHQDKTDPLTYSEYEGPIIFSERKHQWTGVLSNYRTLSLDELEPESGIYRDLVKKEIIKPKKLSIKITQLTEQDIGQIQKDYLKKVNDFLQEPAVKKILEKYEIDPHTVSFANIEPRTIHGIHSGTNILYNMLSKYVRILVFDDKREPRYMIPDAQEGVFYSLPLLAHELAHGRISEHSNEFYKLANNLFDDLQPILNARAIEEYENKSKQYEQEKAARINESPKSETDSYNRSKTLETRI